MAQNYLKLRKKYPKFIFEKYSWKIPDKDLEISFGFKIASRRGRNNIKFRPKLTIKDISKTQVGEVGEKVMNNLVFNLGLIEMLSYWKATCSPEIEIKTGSLNKSQIKWWRKLIMDGMGQFFYENKINFKKHNFLKINTKRSDSKKLKKHKEELQDRILVPVGGGKDSVVTLELLKKAKKEMTCFSLNPTSAARKTMKIAGYPTRSKRKKTKTGGYKEAIVVRRTIDKKLWKLNKEGFLNGHTPFSSYLAFLSVFCAVLFDYKFVVFSNERSANEGNLKYLEKMVNHQYSKSFHFEKKFRNYSKKYLTAGVDYFSFLRPLYELQVAKLFSSYPKYFSSFVSCNEAFKTYSGRRKPLKKWCNKCAKCLFVFAALYPFLGSYRLFKIFKTNLFERIGFLPTMLRLIGEQDFKPFECVGTKKENLVAFYLSWEKVTQEKSQISEANRIIKGEVKKIPFLLKHFQNTVLPKYPNLKKEAKKLMDSWNKKHFLPRKFEKILKRAV